MSCIYKIVNTQTGDFYIGSTIKRFERRKTQHICNLNANRHPNTFLQRLWNKYGSEVFDFQIVESFVFPKDYLKEYIYEYVISRELFYIESLNPKYNLLREYSTGKLGKRHRRVQATS